MFILDRHSVACCFSPFGTLRVSTQNLGPLTIVLSGSPISALYIREGLGMGGNGIERSLLDIRLQTSNSAADSEVSALNKEILQYLIVVHANTPRHQVP